MTQPIIKYGDPLTIANQLDETGVVCLEDAVPTEWLTQARADVEDLLVTHGEHDHFIRSPEGADQSAAEAFITSPAVLSLLTDIVRARSENSLRNWSSPALPSALLPGLGVKATRFGFTMTPAR